MINTYNLKAREKKKCVSWFNFQIYYKNVRSKGMNTFLYIIGITGRTKAEQNDEKNKRNEKNEGNLESLHALSNLEVINKKLKGS